MGKRKASPVDDVEDEEAPKTSKKVPKVKKGHPSSTEPYEIDNGWTAHPPALLHKKHGESKANKIAAFDLDDTLVKLKSRSRVPVDADDFKLFNKKVPQVLQGLAEEGYRLVIFSNQGSIKGALEGKASEKLRGRADNIVAELGVPVHLFYATADEKSEGDTFRKPRTGMWDLLLEELLDGVSPDLKDCFYVGDAAGRDGDFADSDKKFAENVGIAFKVPEDIFGQSDSKKEFNMPSGGENHNLALSNAFRELAALSERQGGNAFGVQALNKVAGIIAAFPRKIASSSELKNVKGVGKSSLQKVEEYLSTGKLHALESAGIQVEQESKPGAGESAAMKFL